MSRLFFLPILQKRCYNAAPSIWGFLTALILESQVVVDISGALK